MVRGSGDGRFGVLRECGGTPGERGIGGNFHRSSSHGFWGLGGSLGRGNVRRYLGFTGGGRPSSFLDGGAAGCSGALGGHVSLQGGNGTGRKRNKRRECR